MTTYVLIFASALLLAVGATPVVRWLAPRLEVIDQPNARKVHTRPIPLLGGAAIYLAFIVALLAFSDRFYISQAVGILLAATLVSFFGFWDDRRSLHPLAKLAGQIIATVILIISGVRVSFLHYLPLDLLVTLVWVVGITNALNLLDNMDGLAGGVGAVASAFFLVLAAMNGQYLVGALSAALLGACLGFLVYNFNPASIFMGDEGALFLGFVLAAAGIKLRFPGHPTVITWMVPVLVLGLAVFDTTLVVVSRLRRGLNPLTTPGKDHLSHRLVALGLSRRRAVTALYLVCGLLGVLAILVSRASVGIAYAIAGMVALAGLAAIWRLERVQWD